MYYLNIYQPQSSPRDCVMGRIHVVIVLSPSLQFHVMLCHMSVLYATFVLVLHILEPYVAVRGAKRDVGIAWLRHDM